MMLDHCTSGRNLLVGYDESTRWFLLKARTRPRPLSGGGRHHRTPPPEAGGGAFPHRQAGAERLAPWLTPRSTRTSTPTGKPGSITTDWGENPCPHRTDDPCRRDFRGSASKRSTVLPNTRSTEPPFPAGSELRRRPDLRTACMAGTETWPRRRLLGYISPYLAEQPQWRICAKGARRAVFDMIPTAPAAASYPVAPSDPGDGFLTKLQILASEYTIAPATII